MDLRDTLGGAHQARGKHEKGVGGRDMNGNRMRNRTRYVEALWTYAWIKVHTSSGEFRDILKLICILPS